jgi:arsenate reductase (thioredoxin)
MKLMFICTHNRCRSILCEAITNHLAGGRILAVSAGSQPAGEIHPLTLKYLQARQIPVSGLASKSWDDIQVVPDAVITVCDSAASEACPLWLGDAPRVHWGLPDPSKAEGTEDEIRCRFTSVMDTVEARIRALMAVPENLQSVGEFVAALQRMAEN